MTNIFLLINFISCSYMSINYTLNIFIVQIKCSVISILIFNIFCLKKLYIRFRKFSILNIYKILKKNAKEIFSFFLNAEYVLQYLSTAQANRINRRCTRISVQIFIFIFYNLFGPN